MPLDLLFPLRFPGYFEAPLFRTFFHFPWDFEIAGFDCNCQTELNFNRLAQLGESQFAEREVADSNPGRTNTQGL